MKLILSQKLFNNDEVSNSGVCVIPVSQRTM